MELLIEAVEAAAVVIGAESERKERKIEGAVVFDWRPIHPTVHHHHRVFTPDENVPSLFLDLFLFTQIFFVSDSLAH